MQQKKKKKKKKEIRSVFARLTLFCKPIKQNHNKLHRRKGVCNTPIQRRKT